MAPKKSSRSALYYYALECMENNSCRAANVREAIEAVYPAWKTMSVTERMPYETRYENWKKTLKEEPIMTITNRTAGSVYEDSNMDESQLIGRKIENILKKHTSNQNELISQPFYFIKFQSFCKCDKFKDVNLNYEYAPYFVLAEVGIIEYSLENGIQNEYHAFIKPNKIPLGFRSACMDTARDVLGEMPLDSFSEVKKSYDQIYQDLYKFIKPMDDENNNNPKVVFSLYKDIAETRFGLKFLHDRAIESKMYNISLIDRIYDLENLVNKLGKLKRDDFGSANEILSSYVFDYTLKTRCEWHEEKGVINCSLGIAKKYAYLISDSMCQLFNIKITKNHVPLKESVSVVVRNNDFGTIRSSRFNTRTSELGSNSKLNERNSTRTSNNNNSTFDEDDRKLTSYNYPIKRSATESPVFASTDIRFNYETISAARSTITESSIPSNIPSIYKPTYSESKTNLAEIPKSLTTEVNDEDGWVTRPSQKNNRYSNQDVKSVISDNSNINDNSSSLSGATKTVSSFKYQGRGKLVKRN